MNHKRYLQLIRVFILLVLSMTVLTGCDFNLRDKRFPRKITFPSEGDTITSNLDFTEFHIQRYVSDTTDDFLILDYDTIYGRGWFQVEVSSEDRTTRFMVGPNMTGYKRRIVLRRYGPDDTSVDIIQNP